MKQVVIHIRGGVAHVVEIPEDVEIVIEDFDGEEPFKETAKIEDGEIIYISGN